MSKHPFGLPNEHVLDIDTSTGFGYGHGVVEGDAVDASEERRASWCNVSYSSFDRVAMILKDGNMEEPVSLRHVSTDGKECIVEQFVDERCRLIRLSLEKFCQDNDIDVLAVNEVTRHKMEEIARYAAPRTNAEEIRSMIFALLTVVIPPRYLVSQPTRTPHRPQGRQTSRIVEKSVVNTLTETPVLERVSA